jgi:site-specific DNA-methyltransferase (adenine-specific)
MLNISNHNTYNTDVLSCIANLSNDEVFTPPDVVNQMLDMLPHKLWSDKSVTFLDPACKSGVFLREIAKRLIVGLENDLPDLQERVDHIFHKQLFGIAITELTSLLSRRSVYCSKYPNSKFSISFFSDVSGNIRFKKITHKWRENKCVFCGASREQYDRDVTLETHAYEYIHTKKPEEIMDMKFDVIIGNPPYQLDTGGSGRQAKPIYQLFVEQAIKLNPRYLSMIIPSRWFAGGMGLDNFRNFMMSNGRISKLTDYANAKDCFPQNSISGGVCYFLWDRHHSGKCSITNISEKDINTTERLLNEFPVLVRHNRSVNILRKVLCRNEIMMSKIVSSISPFGISTKERGSISPHNPSDVCLISSAGRGYLTRNQIQKGVDLIDSYKVIVSQTGSEHAGEPSRDGLYRVLTSTMQVLNPNEICTHSYLTIGDFDNQEKPNGLLCYLQTKFARFLILQAMSSIHLSKSTFQFVPLQDFSINWTDEKLYDKYELSPEEIEFVESMIKPMNTNGDSNGE